jgi:GNAT superfamily N-acetyltransferase
MEQGLINLRPLTVSAYPSFIAEVQERYATSRMKGNLFTKAEAKAFTKTEWKTLLPNGIDTPGHFFLEILNGNPESSLGTTWLFIDYDVNGAFIFDVCLTESSRGKGMGRPTLTAIESFARSEGARSLGLNVFADNNVAKSLYHSFGFQEVSTDMIKVI